MTLHAFDSLTNRSLRWVALPLEFVDWMAARFDGRLIQHLRRIDPYNSILIPTAVLGSAVEEFVEVREHLKKCRPNDIPGRVDIYQRYGLAGAIMTTDQLVEFFEFARTAPCKVVSVGD